LRISREGVFQQPRLLTTVEDLISRLPVIRPRRMMRAFHRIRRTIHFLVLDFARPKIDSTADTVPLGGVNMNKSLLIALACVALFPLNVSTQTTSGKTASFQAVPELPYRVVNNFLKFPKGMSNGESSGVAVNSKGHIFLFQRAKPMLAEYDEKGNFIQSIGEGLFAHPHGLRIDPDDNIWTTDDGNHLVLKLDSSGNVLLVLGRINTGAEANWLFNKPADVAFAKNGDIYVADGYGNSRIVKFDRDGNYIKAWGKYGKGSGEFNLPHGVAVDKEGRVYVGDRENQRIQIFDAEGNFIKQWTDVGYPYGLVITPDQHVWMVDGGYDRIVELDQDGKILGAFGEPGHKPGQMAWAHFMAIGADKTIYVADVLNWRFQVFARIPSTGKMTTYIPSVRMFWGSVPSVGWSSKQADIPFK
jgi:DNA-binding beta-propeller fold protein YncE